jgi:hypothetical protein
MTGRNCQNCKKAIGSRDASYLYFGQVICKACMIKMEEKFQVPGSTGSANSNTETESPIAEAQLEQDKDIKRQTPATEDRAAADLEKESENIKDLEQDRNVKCHAPAAEEKATDDLKKDTEDLKDNVSAEQDDNNSAKEVATESSEQETKKCETNLDKEAVSQPSSNQEKPIEISVYVEKAVRKQTGYIGRHWRGELSLATSFWINVVLIDFILKSAELISAAFLHNPLTGTHVTIIHNPFVIMILYPWQIIGLWRSSERHIETTGKRFWARTAQVLVVLGFIATLSKLVWSWPLYDL